MTDDIPEPTTPAGRQLLADLLLGWPEHGRRKMRLMVARAIPIIEAQARATKATHGQPKGKPNGSGSVYMRRSTQTWVAAVSIPGPDGFTRRTRTAKTREEAEQHLRDLLREHRGVE